MSSFKFTNIKYCIFSYCSVFALPVALGLKNQSLSFSNSVLDILFFCFFYKIIRSAFETGSRRQKVFSIVIGAILSATLILGANIKNYDSALLWKASTYLYVGALTPLISAVVIFIYRGLDGWRNIQDFSIEKKLQIFFGKRNLKFFWFVLILGWLPALLATFPGIYSYDSIFQIKWFFDNTISNHHPFLHTLWLGLAMKIGIDLFHSSQIGLFLYTITQMLLFSGMLAYMLNWLRFKMPSFGILLVLLCLITLPYNALLAISATKDTLFAGIFVIVVIKAYDLVSAPQRFLSSFTQIVSFLFSLIMLCLFRNNGIYVVCFMMLFALFVLKIYWKKIFLIGLICVCFWGFYTNIVFEAFHITKTDMREMMSVPMQQMVRALLVNEGELSLEEKEYIQTCFPAYKNYSPTISDNIKSTARMDIVQEDFGEFVKKWFDIGKKCPFTYLDAWLTLSCGNWYPDTLYPIPGAWHPYLMYDNCTADDGHGHGGDYIWVERVSVLPLLSQLYFQICYNTIHQKVPILSTLMNPGSAFWLMILIGSYYIYKRKYAYIVPLSLLVGLWGTIMLGPVVLIRYSYPLILCIPILIAMALDMEYMVN